VDRAHEIAKSIPRRELADVVGVQNFRDWSREAIL
jgi:hypothetical protein